MAIRKQVAEHALKYAKSVVIRLRYEEMNCTQLVAYSATICEAQVQSPARPMSANRERSYYSPEFAGSGIGKGVQLKIGI